MTTASFAAQTCGFVRESGSEIKQADPRCHQFDRMVRLSPSYLVDPSQVTYQKKQASSSGATQLYPSRPVAQSSIRTSPPTHMVRRGRTACTQLLCRLTFGFWWKITPICCATRKGIARGGVQRPRLTTFCTRGVITSKP